VLDAGITAKLPTELRATTRSLGPGTMTISGGNGDEFQVAGMSGPTRLEVEGVPDGWAVKAILLDGEDVTDKAFEPSGGGTLRIVMTNRLTTVSGTIQSNAEIRDHSVIVFPDDATKWTFPSRFVRTARADRDGRFQLRGLPPGDRYLAVAVDYLEEGEEQDAQFLERLRNRASSFSLGDGEQRSIQLNVTGR
jgi:hypothetical protein